MLTKCPLSTLKSLQRPDKYAYVVLIALFFNVMVTLGVARSIVIYLKEFQDWYNLSYSGSASFIAVYMSAGGLFSIIIAKLCKHFGARPICVICSLIGTLSWMIASGYVAGKKVKYNTEAERGTGQVPYIFISFVGLAGLCHGGVLVNAPVEVNRWFKEEKRGLVNAIVWSGSSFGQIIFGISFSALTQEIGWIDSLFWLTAIQGVIMFATCLTLVDPPKNFLKNRTTERSDLELLDNEKAELSPESTSNSENSNNSGNLNNSESESETVHFKQLNKYRLYKVYILSQVFYGLWRCGVTTFFVSYARDNKAFHQVISVTKSGWLLPIWGVCELLARPIVGKFAKNRYLTISILFILQGILTILLTKADSYFKFCVVIGLMGGIQGGAGGLFLTASIDAVGVNLARYAYSVENTIDVFIAGLAVHMYGHFCDKTKLDNENPQSTIFYIAGGFIFVSGLVSLIGCKMKKFNDYKVEENEFLYKKNNLI